MKKAHLLWIFPLLIAATALAVWYLLTPHTPEQFYQRLQERHGQVAPGDTAGFEQILTEYEETINIFAERFPDSELCDDLAYERCEIADQEIGDITPRTQYV